MTIIRDTVTLPAFRRYCGLSGVRVEAGPRPDAAAATRLGQSLLAGCVFGMRLTGRLLAPIDSAPDIGGFVAAWNMMALSGLPADRPRGPAWATIGGRLAACILDEEILLQIAEIGGLDFDEDALAACHARIIDRLERGDSNKRPSTYSLIDLEGGTWRVLTMKDWVIDIVPARFVAEPAMPSLLTLEPLVPPQDTPHTKLVEAGIKPAARKPPWAVVPAPEG